jgi:hypothetical protein
MSIVRRGVVGLMAVSFVVGCGSLKKAAVTDAGTDAAAVAVVDSGPTNPFAAFNDTDIKHPDDEQKIDPPAPATIMAWAAVAHMEPGGGAAVATLAHDTSVTKMATHDNYVLIFFESPKEEGKHLKGWVTTDAFVGGKVVVTKDGGAGDGGDAGAGDGGATGPLPKAPPNSVEVAPTNGLCPQDFLLGKDTRCHKSCPAGPAGKALCRGATCSNKCGTPGLVCVSALSSCK